MKSFVLKVFAAIVLTALPGLSVAYSDWYKPVLISVFNAREACINTTIRSSFFDPLKKGESYEEKVKSSPLFGGGDDVDKSLAINGRVRNNLTSLLSDKLQRNFSVKTVDCKVSPYRADMEVRVIQSLDVFGGNFFLITLDVDFQEAATTQTGLTGFMSVRHFNGLTVTKSKGEVETQVYIALDQAVEEMKKTFSHALDYCASASCKK